MADDIVKVMRIDTGDSEQTVKGLRQEIKDLRDSILNLKEGTEDYEKAVKKLQTDQQKLDKVMSLTKKGTTALEGSYDALSQKMSLLKKEWKATNEQAKRDEIGKQIASINDELKEMDASIGNYQRNVGNYTNSIIDAFEQLNHSVDEWKNKAADAWAKGDVEAYTEAIREAGLAQAQVERIEQDLETSTPTLEKGFQGLTDTAAGLAGGFEAVQAIMVLTGKDTESFEKVMQKFQVTMALVQGMQALGGLPKSLKAVRTSVRALSVTVKSFMASNPVGWIMLITGAVAGLTTAFIANKKAAKEVQEATKDLVSEQASLRTELDTSSESFGRQSSLLAAQGYSEIEIQEELMKTAQERLKKAQENLEKFGKKYQDLADKTIPKNQKSVREKIKNSDPMELGKILENSYIIGIPELKEIKKLYLEANNIFNEAQTQFDEKVKDLQNTKDIVKAQLGLADEEYETSLLGPIEVLRVKQEKELKLYEDAGMSTVTLLKRQHEEMQALIKEIEDDKKKGLISLAEVSEDLFNDASSMAIEDEKIDLGEDKNLFSKEGLNLQAGLNYRNGINDLEARQKMLDERNRLLEKGVNDEKAWAEMEYNNTLEAEQKKYDTIREYWEKANGPEKLELYQQMKEQELEIDELTYERKKELRDADLAEEAEVMSQKQELFQNSLSLLSTVVKGMGDLYQQDLDNQLAAGKISDEAYQEQFKKVKAMQIAEATINTIAGALGAFMGITKDTGGWGIAVAALQAAAVAATGSFEIAKIAKTEAGAHAVQSGMVQPPANIFNESQPKETHILTGNKEIEELNKSQRVYILENDLEESRKKVQIVDDETSF